MNADPIPQNVPKQDSLLRMTVTSGPEMAGMKYRLLGFFSDSPRKSRFSDLQDFSFS
jgi:hypothetical protein